MTVKNAFPEYEFKRLESDGKFHNMYRGTDLGYGGYVYAEPGMHTNVALLDVVSLHPHSIFAMNCFGEYTKNFKDLLDARICIKHGDYDAARNMLNGKLAPYLKSEDDAAGLSQALKIAINSVYGLTAAKFNNPFRDPRNKNNIVALRGALFMRDLQDEVVNRGFTVAHIKTDSIKIPNATSEIIQFCMAFANEYGYTFEHEATYDRMCLVNDAVYVARYAKPEWCQTAYGYIPKDCKKHGGEWTATGAQFQVPYVFKTLFSQEPIGFDDLCETKSVSSALYLDMNESLPDVSECEKELDKHNKTPVNLSNQDEAISELMRIDQRIKELSEQIAKGHNYIFIGKVGRFCPIKPGCGGGVLVRENDGKYHAATGSKGYRWLESEMVQVLGKEDCIDRSYYDKQVDAALHDISAYGDPEWFRSDDPNPEWDTPPWETADEPFGDTATPFDVR